MSKEKEVQAVVIPPQSSIKLVRHGKDDNVYYTWEVKIYCDDLVLAFNEIKRIDQMLRDEYL